MVQLVRRMALASALMRGDMMDAVEFPGLAARRVPLTVIDGRRAIVGAPPSPA